MKKYKKITKSHQKSPKICIYAIFYVTLYAFSETEARKTQLQTIIK